MRTRAIMLTFSLILLITFTNLGVSVYFAHKSLIKTMNEDLALALDIADELVSTKIDSLKADASLVAGYLREKTGGDELGSAMREQLSHYPDFISFTLFDGDKIADSCGAMPMPQAFMKDSRYQKRLSEGESIITTTRLDTDTDELALYVCVPMGEGHVLSCTIPGMIFSEILSKFRLWQTGGLFLIDEEGSMIAAYTEEWVLERRNYIELAKIDSIYRSSGDFFKRIITTSSGFGYFTSSGKERVCSYEKVRSSLFGWSVCVAVPFDESPSAHVRNGLIIASLSILLFGLLLAFILSKPLLKPFRTIARQNERLLELNEEVKAASKAKNAFLSSVSHEMRTPLNAVIGLSELLLNTGDLKGDTDDKVEKIHTSGITLLSIVNDILDISKMESGKFQILPVEYDVPSAINDAVMFNIMRLGEKPLDFKIEIDESTPCRMYGDDLRIRQIFNNLLSNAFKYTNEGSVIWRLDYEIDGDDVWIISEVRDTGIGIHEEDIDKLFSAYNQVDMGTNRNIEGTGLGLSIVKRLVEAMDGEIKVESEYGVGSTFSVRLRQGFITRRPIGKEVCESLVKADYSAHKRSRNLRLPYVKMPYARVLIVDDVPVNLDVCKGMLKPYAMQVDCAGSGQQAIDAVRLGSPRYDAIFMDHMMPGMDGIKATKIIRDIASEYAISVPIIALTANAIVGNDEIFLQNGFQDFLSKPIDMARLDAVVQRWVRNDERGEIIHADSDAFFDIGVTEIEGVDIKCGLERFHGDQEAYIDVLRSFAVNTGPVLKDAEIYYEDGNLPQYAIAVHGIKGSCYGVCATKVGRDAEALERAAKAKDMEKLRASHDLFIEDTKSLLRELCEMLARIDAKNDKPRAAAPNPEDMEDLREACGNFDMDGVDGIMARIEGFVYESGGRTVEWLRERIDNMDLDEIYEGEWPK